MSDGAEARAAERLVLVYNADSGVLNMLRDALDKLRGRSECSLCDITHHATGEKQAFRACKQRLSVPLETRYRDTLEPELSRVVGDRLPALVVVDEGRPLLLVGPERLDACQGEVAALEALMHREAARLGLSL